MKILNRLNIEGLRGELFHMILFAMAWVMIGEYSFDFKDYAIASIVVLLNVVWLAIYSIRLYDLEYNLPEEIKPVQTDGKDPFERRKSWLFALIFIFEGVAILTTWMMLLKFQREYWLVPSFALIAGLHFFPLARLIRHRSYYMLGTWICAIAVVGYFILYNKPAAVDESNTLIAYGCAAGAVLDGIWVVVRTEKLRRLRAIE